jgi:ATP-dependent Clp protease ATP-binding subunit ClpA
MFERFTDRARRVVVLAQEEARLLRHDSIGTEHLLLGLIKENDGVAVKALESLDVDLEALRLAVVEIAGEGGEVKDGHIPFRPEAKKVLELSLREALLLGHNYIGTEHILLGLLRDPDTPAAIALAGFGADGNRVRLQVVTLLGSRPDQRVPVPARQRRVARPDFPSLHSRLTELTARVDSLQAEVKRLSGLLREHGIDPAGPDELAGN